MDEHAWQETLARRARMERAARRILGVGPDADAAAVRRAYWLAAMKTHPDRAGADEASAARFRAVAAAYEVLTKGPRAGTRLPEADGADAGDVPGGGYRENAWGYFAWWREAYMDGSDETPRRPRGSRGRRGDASRREEPPGGSWW